MFPRLWHSSLQRAPVIRWRTFSSSFTPHQTKQTCNLKDFAKLDEKINQKLSNQQGPLTNDSVIDALQMCKSLQNEISEYDKFWTNPINIKLNDKIEQILLDDKVKFSKELLIRIFLLKFPTKININVIEAFYKRNPQEHIDKNIALIPFRYSLFNGDLRNALNITDLTTGHPNYINYRNKQLRNGVLKLAATALGVSLFSKVGVQEIIELGYLSDKWRHLSSINAMILTYILNSSFFVTIVRVGRQLVAGGGDYLAWQKGTFYTHWFRHADELALCAKLVETDIELNGGGPSGGAPSAELAEELCRRDETDEGHILQPGFTRDGKKVRLLELKDNLEDLKMQAYWMSGGDGFEWVEPDQDPAIIIWKHHLSRFDKKNIASERSNRSLKWAEDLIEEK